MAEHATKHLKEAQSKRLANQQPNSFGQRYLVDKEDKNEYSETPNAKDDGEIDEQRVRSSR